MDYQDFFEGTTLWPVADGGRVSRGLTMLFAGKGGGARSTSGNGVIVQSGTQPFGSTQSWLIQSDDDFSALDTNVYARWTNQRQLHASAEPWETGWLIYRMLDRDSFAYVAVKTNGWEMGIRHPSYYRIRDGVVINDGQKVLASGDYSPIRPDAGGLGAEVVVEVRQRGRKTIIIINDVEVWGRTLAKRIDDKLPPRGRVALYGEDCEVSLRALNVISGVPL